MGAAIIWQNSKHNILMDISVFCVKNLRFNHFWCFSYSIDLTIFQKNHYLTYSSDLGLTRTPTQKVVEFWKLENK